MRCIFVLIALLCAFTANAQDVIIRITGDTLRAKIDSQNDAFLYFYNHESKSREIEVISKKEVAEVLYDFDSAHIKKRKAVGKRNYRMVHLSLQYAGYYINNTEMVIHKGIDGYYEKLQFATGAHARAEFFFDEHLGLGGMYSLAKSYNSVGNVLAPWGASGKLVDDITMNYYGLHAVMRYQLGDSQADVLLALGGGWQTFRNKGAIVYEYEITGKNFGFHASGQFNLFLGDGIYVSISAGYIGKEIGHLAGNFNAMPQEMQEDLNNLIDVIPNIGTERIFIGAGLTFSF